MSETFDYEFTNTAGTTDEFAVTVATPPTTSTGLGPAYAVTAISGYIDITDTTNPATGIPITGLVGPSGVVTNDGTFIYDNAVFTTSTDGYGGGNVNGIDLAGIQFDIGAVNYNLYSNSGNFVLIDSVDPSIKDGLTLVSTNAPCYCAGTMILTERGEVAVENLAVGDLLVTAAGGHMPIRWTGATRAALGAGNQASLAPVRIAAGALAENVPHRDLYVSPDHAMFLQDMLVPARLLLNGITITQPARLGEITYYHVELEPHEVIIAEGAAAESYLDFNDRGLFNQSGVTQIFAATEAKTWEDSCAPLLLAGPVLTRIQAELAMRARQLDARAGDAKVA